MTTAAQGERRPLMVIMEVQIRKGRAPKVPKGCQTTKREGFREVYAPDTVRVEMVTQAVERLF